MRCLKRALTWMVMRRSARASCGTPPACLEAAKPSRMRAVRMRSSRRLMPEAKVEALTPAAEVCIEALWLGTTYIHPDRLVFTPLWLPPLQPALQCSEAPETRLK